MEILLVEDNAREVSRIRAGLKSALGDVEVPVVTSESAFYLRMESGDWQPELVVLDVILPWSKTATVQSDASKSQLPREAGLRCAQWCCDRAAMSSIPIILYTALERNEVERNGPIPSNALYLHKQGGDELVRLVRALFPRFDGLERIDRNVFLVHGHDPGAEGEIAQFIFTIGLRPIVFHDVARPGVSVLDNFLANSHAAYAVVLLTPDDVGRPREDEEIPLRFRARQNVIFELGYFVAMLGSQNVCAVVKGDLEIPTDYSGVLYVALDRGGAWKLKLFRAMQQCGLPVTFDQEPK
jgi:CheY-like chemotaxis protein